MKDVVGYEGLYFITKEGDIYNKNGLLIKQQIDKYGYVYVKLCKFGIAKKHKVHRLVAEAFIENPLNLPCVNHKDENKTNNHVDNLEWCTVSYNNSYGSRLSKIRKRIIRIDINGTIAVYNSIQETEHDGFILSCVKLCLSGKQEKHKNNYWEYF
jgi:hypothetical protein